MFLTTLSTHCPPHLVAALPVVWRTAAVKIDATIDQLLEQLRTSVSTSATLPEKTRDDLLAHLEAMEEELKAHPEGSTEVAPAKFHGLARLRASAEELEASHPDITSLVSRLATHLSNLGI